MSSTAAVPTIDQIAAPRFDDDDLWVDPELKQLLESKGYAVSWQSTTNNSQSKLHSMGIVPLHPEWVKEFDAELYDKLFKGSPGTQRLFTQGDTIRNQDAVLCVQARGDRERYLEMSHAKWLKQRGSNEDPRKVELKQMLAEMGLASDVTQSGDLEAGVNVVGAEDAQVAAAVEKAIAKRGKK